MRYMQTTDVRPCDAGKERKAAVARVPAGLPAAEREVGDEGHGATSSVVSIGGSAGGVLPHGRSGRSSCTGIAVASDTTSRYFTGSGVPFFSQSETVDCGRPIKRANADCDFAAITARASAESDSCSSAMCLANSMLLDRSTVCARFILTECR